MASMLLNVTYTARAGEREAFLDAVAQSGLLEVIRAEDGCLGYEYFCSADDPDKILLVEKWESEPQQQVHLAQPHMAELKGIKDRYIVDTQVEKAFLA